MVGWSRGQGHNKHLHHNALGGTEGFKQGKISRREIDCLSLSLTFGVKGLEPKTRQGEYRVVEEAWDSKSPNFTLLLNSDSPNRGYQGDHFLNLLLLTLRRRSIG